MMSEHMHVPVAATEKCAQNPAHDADNDRAPERAPEVIHMEADHTLGTTSSNRPFRMRIKKPSVTRISGALRINRKGRTNALRMPSKSEAPINAATVS